MARFYEVVFKQKFLGEVMSNVFHFKTADESATAQDLRLAFIEDMVPKINGIQHAGADNYLLQTKNLFDLADFDEASLTGEGARPDSEVALPLFVAVNFTLRANSRLVRPGKKRFSGLSSLSQNSGTINRAAEITAIELLRVALFATIQNGGSGVPFSPIVVKRVKETDTETGKVTYRMPTTVGELQFADVVTALSNLRLTTQDTRGNAR